MTSHEKQMIMMVTKAQKAGHHSELRFDSLSPSVSQSLSLSVSVSVFQSLSQSQSLSPSVS